MKITATHPEGECKDCDELRAVLALVPTGTCARIAGVACIALAEEEPA